MTLPPQRIVQNESTQAVMLAMVREVYSRRPETRSLESWEMQHVLFSLGYTDDLAEEAEISAAVEVARTDWTQDEDAA
jgi:hypothetical protein